MSYGVRILLYLSFLLPLSIWSQENNWELKKMRNGIQVYTRTIPNSTNKEYKAVVTVKSSMEKQLQHFWMATICTSGIIKLLKAKLSEKSTNILLLFG